MLNNFERETHELTDYEKKLVNPIVNGLKTKIGVNNAITNKKMVAKMKDAGYKISEVRIRKIINYIRTKKLLLNLISSSKGYWIENDPKRIKEYIQSLDQRINEIKRVRNSFIEEENGR